MLQYPTGPGQRWWSQGGHVAGDFVLVFTTAPDNESAERVARLLVEERLAACVNVHGPMASIFRWKGTVEGESERQLVIKTTRGRLSALEARVRALHSYELPEFLVLSVDSGSAAYLEWVEVATQPGQSD
jgi:periplasmic divalent cation tolerance protein